MNKKIRLSIIIASIALLSLVVPVNIARAACEPSFDGMWIICGSQAEEFFRQASENCDGVLLGDVLILAGC